MIENKFNPGDRVQLAIDPSDVWSEADAFKLEQGKVYHVDKYVRNLLGITDIKMLMLKESSDTQFAESVFIHAKRRRTEAVRIRPIPSYSRGNKV